MERGRREEGSIWGYFLGFFWIDETEGQTIFRVGYFVLEFLGGFFDTIIKDFLES